MNTFLTRHRGPVLLLAVLLPVGAAAALGLVRNSIATPNAALVLVLVVVAAASTGIRLAGVLAAASSALSFDYFLTAPYHRLAIADRADVETAVLLMLVGLAVGEIALWGRRQQARASRQHGYLDGVLQTVGAFANEGADPDVLVQSVAGRITEVLQIDRCRYTTQTEPTTGVRIEPDGTLTRDGHPLDVARFGLPTDSEIELAVASGGRFLLTAAGRIRRPTLEQRQVVVALAHSLAKTVAS